MVYSSKDFNIVDFCHDSAKYANIKAFAAPKVESLWFLYQAEGLPKKISIEEFLDEPSGKAERCTKHGVDFPTFDNRWNSERRVMLARTLLSRDRGRALLKWYRKTHKRV